MDLLKIGSSIKKRSKACKAVVTQYTVFYDSCTVRLVAGESGGAIAASPLQTRENFGIAVRKGNAALKAALDAAIAERSAP